MFPVVDWLMILITTIVTYKSYKKLVLIDTALYHFMWYLLYIYFVVSQLY